MRIILDECLPVKLASSFGGYTITTVSALGRSGIRNGELLAKLEDDICDVFVTVDKNLRHQQKITGRPFAVLVLDSHRNTLSSLKPHVERLLEELPVILPGTVYVR